MRRLLSLLALPGIVPTGLALTLALAPAAFADEASPAPSFVTADVVLGTDPLLPYVVALLVMSAVLMVVGAIAVVMNRRPSRPAKGRGRPAWWACVACGTTNVDDREACFSCGASRAPRPRAP
ncbi:MAG: zinc finger Ran-binding domain-containing protein [Chloroflexi bacterium]|nr:zinc finger Ran-binding domain-containing protein [Chloroflexota bacterium]